MPANDTADKGIRIDKWLWAARFFKTRSLAKQAIEGGKVHYKGQRVKTSKTVELGAELKIRCGWDDKMVVVTALPDKRGNAASAAQLYCETPESIAGRELRAEERKASRSSQTDFSNKPNKKQRRLIHRFKQSNAIDSK